MKRMFSLAASLLLCLALLGGTASADTGPKQSLTITVVNAPEGVYYLDLLQQDGDGSPNIHREDYDPTLLEGLEGWEDEGWYPALVHGTNPPLFGDLVPGEDGAPHQVHAINGADGYMVLETKTIVLAMGCRERTRGAIAIPGTRPAGIFTAGAAQRYVNMEGWLPGKRVVILGSGDIGLIMARRMTLEGAKVLACVEVMPYSGGLNRNIVQCLHDYDIPLYLSHTVTDIRGRDRVEQVVVSQVDDRRQPIPGTEMVFDCDTLLLSVGLIPENELTRQAGIQIDPRTNGAIVWENMETSLPGVFASGNVAHVHDLVDFVTAESQRAGKAAAQYVQEGPGESQPVLEVQNGDGVTYTVPQHIRPGRVEKACDLFFRVNRVCGPSRILVTSGGAQVAAYSRDYLAPGEMEHIMLPRKLLDGASGTLTVSIEEVASK